MNSFYCIKKVLVSKFVIVCIIITSCNKSNPYVIFAEKNVLTNESRMSLEKRLDDNKIEFKTDEFDNILIKESDINKAVICCS